jgi:hypothetical protein
VRTHARLECCTFLPNGAMGLQWGSAGVIPERRRFACVATTVNALGRRELR